MRIFRREQVVVVDQTMSSPGPTQIALACSRLYETMKRELIVGELTV